MTDERSESAIRAIIEARATATRAGDVNGMMADVADDTVTFDVVDPLRSGGKTAARKRAVAWLASYDGGVCWEGRDIHVAVDAEVAFSHALSHVSGRLKTGTAIDMWFRTTLCFRRISGRWLVFTSTAPRRSIRKTARRRSV